MNNCTCHACGQPLPTDPAEQMIERLREACRDNGYFVTWDGYISEKDAAALLGKKHGTLRSWRGAHRPLMFRKLRGRVQYQLADVAALLISAEEIAD